MVVALRKKLLAFFFFLFNCFGSSSVVSVELQTDGGCDQLLGQFAALNSCFLSSPGKGGRLDRSVWLATQGTSLFWM